MGFNGIFTRLNADHKAVVGTNVRYLNVQTEFGSSHPEGLLQLTRFFEGAGNIKSHIAGIAADLAGGNW
jgi:hypothetical protein